MLSSTEDWYVELFDSDQSEGSFADDLLGEGAHIVFNSLVDSVVVMDEQGEICAVNKAAEVLFGFTEQEMLGAPVAKLMPAPTDAAHDAFVKSYVDTGVATILGIGRELLAQNKDGMSFPVHLVTTELQKAGKRIFIGVMRDLSSVGESQRLLSEQRAHLAQAGRLITMGELMTSIAHEINQPLAAITTYAQACQRILEKEVLEKDKIAGALDKLSEQALRAGRAIEGIQRFVKRPVGAHTLVNLNAILAEIQHLIAGDALLAGIEVVYRMTPQAIVVNCDTSLIQQVALNLLRNAIDAMREVDCAYGSQVVLSTELIDTMVRVSVEDSGSGVADRDLPYIFTALHSTKENGIGLGLSICKSIVEDHKGEIGFVNKASGHGCIFYFVLPMTTIPN